MYPSRFDYSAPTSLEEVLAKLAEVGEEGRVLAGGQSLIPMMKLRLAAPSFLVDINKLTDLAYVRRENGHLAVGALARHAEIAELENLADFSPVMADVAPSIADPLVRNRGTLCGSVAHCDPEGDWNSVMLAVGATVVAVSTEGERTIPIDEFIVDFFTNSLQTGEMVKEVRVPIPPGRKGGAYLKLHRKVGDYATVGVATHLEFDDAGKISKAGIGLTSVGPHNSRAAEAEAALVGQEPNDELFDHAGELAAASCEPASDVRGPTKYKRAVVKEYTKRGLLKAANGGN
ncbi:MAG: FAD binding domain-containing protein [Acidimicrobiia bacterium]